MLKNLLIFVMGIIAVLQNRVAADPRRLGMLDGLFELFDGIGGLIDYTKGIATGVIQSHVFHEITDPISNYAKMTGSQAISIAEFSLVPVSHVMNKYVPHGAAIWGVMGQLPKLQICIAKKTLNDACNVMTWANMVGNNFGFIGQMFWVNPANFVAGKDNKFMTDFLEHIKGAIVPVASAMHTFFKDTDLFPMVTDIASMFGNNLKNIGVELKNSLTKKQRPDYTKMIPNTAIDIFKQYVTKQKWKNALINELTMGDTSVILAVTNAIKGFLGNWPGIGGTTKAAFKAMEQARGCLKDHITFDPLALMEAPFFKNIRIPIIFQYKTNVPPLYPWAGVNIGIGINCPLPVWLNVGWDLMKGVPVNRELLESKCQLIFRPRLLVMVNPSVGTWQQFGVSVGVQVSPPWFNAYRIPFGQAGIPNPVLVYGASKGVDEACQGNIKCGVSINPFQYPPVMGGSAYLMLPIAPFAVPVAPPNPRVGARIGIQWALPFPNAPGNGGLKNNIGLPCATSISEVKSMCSYPGCIIQSTLNRGQVKEMYLVDANAQRFDWLDYRVNKLGLSFATKDDSFKRATWISEFHWRYSGVFYNKRTKLKMQAIHHGGGNFQIRTHPGINRWIANGYYHSHSKIFAAAQESGPNHLFRFCKLGINK